MENIKKTLQPEDASSNEKYRFILKGTPFENDNLCGFQLPYASGHTAVSMPFKLNGKVLPNRICYQPMEGQDADTDGSPTDLTFERYQRLARGGAAIVWVEATAVLPEGRSNPHQLMLTDENAHLFAKLVSNIKKSCSEENGFMPTVILQLNHSGRYSKPDGSPSPMIAYNDEVREKTPLPKSRIVSDEYLSGLPVTFAKSASLAAECGFDGVDVKCCHGYLFSELLSAYDRNGLYGGSFENRTRLLLDTFSCVDKALPKDVIRACRLNLYDNYGNLAKYSFGMKDGRICLDEADKIIKLLEASGLGLLNATVGSPYINPHISRPYKNGIDKPPINSLAALSEMLCAAGKIHSLHSELPLVNTGASGFCAMADFAAEGLLSDKLCDFVGFGRMSFAYPDTARDIVNGRFDPSHACVACSGCSHLKKSGRKSGCIVRNDMYKKIFKEMLNEGID